MASDPGSISAGAPLSGTTEPVPAPLPAPTAAPAPRATSRKDLPVRAVRVESTAHAVVSEKRKRGKKTKAEQAAARAEHAVLMATWRDNVRPLNAEQLQERFDLLCVAKTGAEFEAEEGVESGTYGGEKKVYIGVVHKILMGPLAAPYCFKVKWDEDDTEESMHYEELKSHHLLFREKQPKGTEPKRKRPVEWVLRQTKKKLKRA